MYRAEEDLLAWSHHLHLSLLSLQSKVHVKQLNLLMAPLVISSFQSQFHPPSPPSQIRPPSPLFRLALWLLCGDSALHLLHLDSAMRLQCLLRCNSNSALLLIRHRVRLPCAIWSSLSTKTTGSSRTVQSRASSAVQHSFLSAVMTEF